MIALGLELFLFMMVLQQTYGGFYKTILMRGATASSYILPRILCDFFMCLLFFEALWATNAIYGLDTTGWQAIGLLWCVAQSLYIATFNIVAQNRPGLIFIKVIIMVLTLMLCNFSGSFTGEYTKTASGQNITRVICWIGMASPTVQLVYGILFIQYRNVVYVL